MTTTAATTNASASTSTPPKDSPGLHDYDDDDDDVDATSKSNVDRQSKQQHNHFTEQKCQNNLEQSPSPQKPQPPPPLQTQPQSPSQHQSASVDVSNTSNKNANATPTVPPTQTTTSSAPSIVNDTLSNHQLEQSTSSQPRLQQSTTTTNSSSSSSNNNSEQKRPMNAFLLFCKRQRSLVKEKYPNLENRGITKILGDWWSKLDKEQKSKYTDLARQHKEAFMKANPDFKWCKTPNVSNINNNISLNGTDNESCNNSNSNQHHQQQTQHLPRLQQNNRHPQAAINTELMSLQSIHHPMEGVVHLSSNSMDIMLKSRQQLEAPKPPKKRFLERNDSVYTTKNSFGPNHNDTNSHGTDVVPYISLDQDFLDRVIDKAFSEDSNSIPSGVNSCKCSNRNTTNNLTASSNNPTSFSSSSASNYTTNIDEPVDFSMNRTINATSQQIINNLVEKMLSEGPDNSSSFSKMNGTDSVKPQIRPPVKRDNPDDT